MLYLIGLGLKPAHLTLEAIETIKKCRTVFLESYTSRYSEGSVKELEKILHKKIIALKRKNVEEEFESIFEKARKQNNALLVFGNPLTATTHIQVLLDAKQRRIPVQVVPGISIVDQLPRTGLDAYKFGRICTIVFQEPNYSPESFFGVIENNFQNGLHSLCLLDIRTEEKRLMGVSEAVQILQKIAEKKSWKCGATAGCYAQQLAAIPDCVRKTE